MAPTGKHRSSLSSAWSHKGRAFWFMTAWLVNQCYLRTWFQLRLVGQAHAPKQGPVILVSNHLSWIDSLLVSAVTRRKVSFLIAREFYDRPGIRWFTHLLDCVPVARDGHDVAAVKGALRILHSGGVLGAFPEGQISTGGTLQPGREGVAMLALRTGVPVVPVCLRGPVWTASFGWAFLRPRRVWVAVGAPLSFSKVAHPSREQLQEATAAIMDAIRALGGH